VRLTTLDGVCYTIFQRALESPKKPGLRPPVPRGTTSRRVGLAVESESVGQYTQPQAAQILLLNGHAIVRQALRALLENEGFAVIEASEHDEALSLAAEFHPAAAILDLSMPLLKAIDTCREILAVSPHTKVIMLSRENAPVPVLSALRSGASGYLVENEKRGGLSKAVREVLQGNICLSPEISKTVVQMYLAGESRPDILSGRERQVVQLIAEGMATKTVAALLGISVKTAESHRNRIMQKLDIHETAGIVRYAIRHGLIQP
jgi:two-component system, NarL family, response regulator NreC